MSIFYRMYFVRIISLQLLIILSAFVLLEALQTRDDSQLSSPQNVSKIEFDTNLAEVKRKILFHHNNFRKKVLPTASNMLLMTWHSIAAKKAQRYAEKCKFQQHSNVTVPDLGVCGQNLYTSAYKQPWTTAIKSWFDENQKFTYGNPKLDVHDVGHYTQMVWATSYKMGCGVARCSSGAPWEGGVFYNYVCQYCPTGNFPTFLHYPYKKGEPCSDCPNHCFSGSLCTNPCLTTDYFSNCHELVNKLSTSYCTRGYCNATCQCDNKIHKNYPW